MKNAVYPWVFTIPCIIILTSCSQQPSHQHLKEQLQNQLPPYLEITSFKIKEQEKTGSKVEPIFTARLDIVSRFKEDTFLPAEPINSIPLERQQHVTLIKLARKQGETINFYVISRSVLVGDNWQTSLKFEDQSLHNLGQIKSDFRNPTILRDSTQEEYLIFMVKQDLAAERKAIITAIKSQKELSGKRLETEGKGHNFKLKFTSFDEKTGNLTGIMRYPDAETIIEIEGKLQGNKIEFKGTQVLEGNITLNSTYTLNSVSPKQMNGKRMWPENSGLFFSMCDFRADIPCKILEENIVLSLE